jgi:hypothetical protein
VAVGRPAELDMRLVAEATRSALKGTGRAQVDFSIFTGRQDATRGVMRLAFEGENLEMIMEFAPSEGGPGFRSQNRTVDGEFYLLDGPPGQQRWVHDVNASGQQGSDTFNVDPRTFLDLVEPAATFETVSTDEDGVRRLRATRVDNVPPFTLGDTPAINLGQGQAAIDSRHVKRLELWVGPDDVVRKFDLDIESTETRQNSGGRARLVKKPDGTFAKEIDPAFPGKTVTETMRTSYSVRFFDLGEPLEIEAPSGATQVEGKG